MNGCVITTSVSAQDLTFAEVATAILGSDVMDINPIKINELLIKKGHTMTLTQVEKMVEATERGDETGMRIDDEYGSSFLVKGANRNNLVLVDLVDRDAGFWHPYVLRVSDYYRLRANSRLLVRNWVEF